MGEEECQANGRNRTRVCGLQDRCTTTMPRWLVGLEGVEPSQPRFVAAAPDPQAAPGTPGRTRTLTVSLEARHAVHYTTGAGIPGTTRTPIPGLGILCPVHWTTGTGTASRTRTYNLPLRRRTLCPIELPQLAGRRGIEPRRQPGLEPSALTQSTALEALRGIEPRPPGSKPGALTVTPESLVGVEGFEPSLPGPEPGVLPLNHTPMMSGYPPSPRSRTRQLMDRSLVGRVGFEPTISGPPDRRAQPDCPTARLPALLPRHAHPEALLRSYPIQELKDPRVRLQLLYRSKLHELLGQEQLMNLTVAVNAQLDLDPPLLALRQ